MASLKKGSAVNGTGDDGGRTCIVCYKNTKYYSVGACDHSVCFECSSRMRCLLEKNECTICRQMLDYVIFTKERKQFKDLQHALPRFIFIPKWGIYMQSEEIKQDFYELMEHRCKFCNKNNKVKNGAEQSPVVFSTLEELAKHVGRTHQLYACELCAHHIKVFTKERRFYSFKDYEIHEKEGDKNMKHDTSQRGHPLCKFCNKRYFDKDELFRHLRTEHYYCW
jgi:E3 ubiquitin-protein ligase ZNF598